MWNLYLLPFQVAQNDKQLAKYIRENWIRPPSKLQYQLHNPERRDHSMGQSIAVDHILQQKVHKYIDFFFARVRTHSSFP